MRRKSGTSEDGVSLRIEVASEGATISSQARTYAEYRVFAALTRVAATRTARRARVTLRPVNENAHCEEILCTVIVRLEPSETIRVRAIGAHPYAAINRAVERLRTAIEPTGRQAGSILNLY